MKNQEGLLTTTQAAEYLGVVRQTIANAAKKGEIGQKYDAPGTRDGWIYMFTRPELDAWDRREKHPGGRPKSEAAQMSPI